MKMSHQEAKQFFEIMMPMLRWIKMSKGECNAQKTTYADKSRVSQEANALLRMMWERPEYIDEYLDEKGDALPQRARRTLSRWRKYFIRGPFFVERYTNTGAIFISVRDGQVYLVSGITSDIEEGLSKNNLPCVVETALIPYKGKIIYDSTMRTFPEILNSEGKQELARVYESAKKHDHIIKTLPANSPTETNEQWEHMVQAIIPALFEKMGNISQEELSRRISDDPDVNLISKANLAVLERLLGKMHRSQKDWDRIQDILFSGDVFTAEPTIATSHIRSVDHILCNDGVLHVFSTVEKCQKYIKHLSEKHPSQRYFQIGTLPYEAAIEIANDNQMNLFLDYQIGDPWKKFLVYDSEASRLSATIAL